MAFIQNIKVPAEKAMQFQLSEFSGGLNNSTSPFNIAENESPNLKNVLCFDNGQIVTRPGTFKYSNDTFPSRIDKVFTYETSAFSYFVLSSTTRLYVVPIDGGKVRQITTVNDVISGFQLEDKFYFVDGDKYKVYDGTVVYEIEQPLSLVGTATAGGASTITLPSSASDTDGFYNEWVIYIHSGTGQLQTRTINSYVGSTKIATVSEAWTVAPDATSNFYLANGVHGEVVSSIDTSIDDNGIWSVADIWNDNDIWYDSNIWYDDLSWTRNTGKMRYIPTYQQVADTFLGTNNIGDIVKCKQTLYHKDRVYLTKHTDNKNTLYYSDLDNPLYIPANQFTFAITNDADEIKGVNSFSDVLIIFKGETIFALYGNDENDFTLKEIAVACGTININTVARANNYLYFLGSDGNVYSLYDVRTDYQKILTVKLSDKIILNKEPISLHDSDWEKSTAVFYDQHYFLSIDDKVLVYKNGAWLLWDNLNAFTFHTYKNTLLLTNNDNYTLRIPLRRFYVTEEFVTKKRQKVFTTNLGYINDFSIDANVYVNDILTTDVSKLSNSSFKLPQVTAGDVVKITYLSLAPYNDNGKKYESYWESKDFDFGYPSKVKQVRKLYLTAETYKHFESQVSFDMYFDYFELNIDFVMRNQITLWGKSVFGDKFLTRNIVDSVPIEINKRGRILRFRVSTNEKDQPFRMYSIYGEIVVRK